MGSASTYSEKIHAAAVNLTREGRSAASVQETIGISKQTFKRWMDGFPKFRRDIYAARDRAKLDAAEVAHNDDVVARITLGIRQGMSVAGARRCANMSGNEFFHRLKTDPDFEAAIELAKGEVERKHVKRLTRIAKANPDGSFERFFLERRFPEEWSPQTRDIVQQQLKAVYDKLERLPPEIRIVVFQELARDDGDGDSRRDAAIASSASAPVLGPAIP